MVLPYSSLPPVDVQGPAPSPETAPRPYWLQDAHLVRGFVSSTATDLPGRMERLYEVLKRRGWVVAVKSIDTSPFAYRRHVDLYLKRPNSTVGQAAAELAESARGLNMDYVVLLETAKDLADEAVRNLPGDIGRMITARPSFGVGGALLLGLFGLGAWAYSKK